MASPVSPLCEAIVAPIASGQSISAAINLGGRVPCGFFIPATWTAAGLTFQGSIDGVTFVDVWDAAAEVSVAAVVSRYVAVDHATFYGLNYIKVRSGTSAAAVVQAGARVVTIMAADPSLL